MRHSAITTVLAATLLAVAAPAAGQAPGIDLKLNPRIGLYVPLSDLGEQTAGSVTQSVALDNSLAIGLGAELQLGALPFGIRANLDYATGSQVNVRTGEVEDEGSEVTLLAVAADLVFRPLPKIIVLQPYLFAGGGLKQYEFEASEAGAADFQSEGDPTVHLGFGLDLGLGPIALNAELGDYISWFELSEGDDESSMQHDLFVTAGFVIGLL